LIAPRIFSEHLGPNCETLLPGSFNTDGQAKHMVQDRQSHSQPDSDLCWEIQIPSDISECRRAVDELISRAELQGVAQNQAFALRNSLHEAVVNAVRHGNRQDPEKQVRIAWHFVGRDVWIEVEDQGNGFNTELVPDPRLDKYRSRPHGRGLLLMRHFMSSVEYNEPGNCVRMLHVNARTM